MTAKVLVIILFLLIGCSQHSLSNKNSHLPSGSRIPSGQLENKSKQCSYFVGNDLIRLLNDFDTRKNKVNASFRIEFQGVKNKHQIEKQVEVSDKSLGDDILAHTRPVRILPGHNGKIELDFHVFLDQTKETLISKKVNFNLNDYHEDWQSIDEDSPYSEVYDQFVNMTLVNNKVVLKQKLYRLCEFVAYKNVWQEMKERKKRYHYLNKQSLLRNYKLATFNLAQNDDPKKFLHELDYSKYELIFFQGVANVENANILKMSANKSGHEVLFAMRGQKLFQVSVKRGLLTGRPTIQFTKLQGEYAELNSAGMLFLGLPVTGIGRLGVFNLVFPTDQYLVDFKSKFIEDLIDKGQDLMKNYEALMVVGDIGLGEQLESHRVNLQTYLHLYHGLYFMDSRVQYQNLQEQGRTLASVTETTGHEKSLALLAHRPKKRLIVLETIHKYHDKNQNLWAQDLELKVFH